MRQLFLRVAVRIDRNGESTVAVEFRGARGTFVPEPFAVRQNRAVKVPKGKLALVLVEEPFRFRLIFDEPEQSLGVGQDAVRPGISGRFKILQTADFGVVRLLLAAVAFGAD